MPESGEQPAAAPVKEMVIDASVAAKWLLRDEENTEQADALLHLIDRDQVVAYAPRQIHVEVAAAIRKAVLAGRLSSQEGKEAIDDWLEVYRQRLIAADNEELLAWAIRRALALGITLFDALYVVLAERLDVTLVVADQRLLHSPAAQLELLRDLSQVEMTP